MRTIEELIEELKRFPMNAYVHAYEGEITGVVVTSSNMARDLGYIPLSFGPGDKNTVIHPKPSRKSRKSRIAR